MARETYAEFGTTPDFEKHIALEENRGNVVRVVYT